MFYCPQCGVEVDSGIQRCPLCGGAIQDGPNEGPLQREIPITRPDAKPRLTKKSRRNLTWEVISILCGIAILVVAATDFRANATIGWSRFPMGSVLLFWVESTVVIYLGKQRLLLALTTFIALIAFLGFLALASGDPSWLFELALPLLVISAGIAGLATFIITRLTFLGLNAVAIVSLGAAAMAVAVNALVVHYLSGHIGVNWSIIVLQVLIPFSGIMFFLHYRLRSRFDFKRIFHL